jgi:pSer/pThr/pTyr-binding forkhead associated (FHA) protein
MELIIRIPDHTGRAPQYYRFNTNRITIGRAFDNDLILNDSTVSPHHAVIEVDDEGQIVLKDLSSLNGVYTNHHMRVHGTVTLESGNEFTVGKTHLQFYTPEHSVEETVQLEKANRLMDQLGNPAVSITALIMVAMLYAIEQWLNMISEFKWQDIVNVELFILGGVLLVGIFWSVVGRIIRHEANFRKQVTVILIFVIFQFILSKFFEFLQFNTLNYYLSLSFFLIIEFVLMTILLWFNLNLATNQTSQQRRKTAFILSLLLISLTVYTEMSFNDEFSDRPDYVKKLDPPWLRLSGTVSENEYVSDSIIVFEQLEQQ